MEQENLIRLIVLEESSHDAEILASSLRNAGHAVRSTHVKDAEGLGEALQSQNWDIFISAPKVGEMSAIHAIEAINNVGKDIPCIIFGEQPDKESRLEMIQAGAVECISADEQDYFLIVLERELNHLQQRRAYRECQTMLSESERRNRTLLDSSRDPIAYIHEGMHIYANLSYLELFGYNNSEDMESIPIMDLIASQDQQKFKDVLRKLSKGDLPERELEFQVINSEGAEFKAIMHFSAASIEGEVCTQIAIHRESSNAELERELDQLRKQDLLTGLYNRQYFMDELANSLNRAHKGEHNAAMMYVEPDNFKSIKDTLGIAGSDLVLSDFAAILKDNLPQEVILARFAGTIFTAIFNNTEVEVIGELAEQIRKKFEQHIFDIEGKSVASTCSIGITPITETSTDSKQVISQADSACAKAKQNKGNKIHIHTVADQLAGVESERAWVKRLSMALKQNRFILHYQPIVSLHAEPGERYEVYVRMLDSNDNLISPTDFIKPAENANMMPEIDRWVLKNAAKALLEKRRLGTEARFFIKLSADSIEEAGLLPWLSKLLKAARLHGSSLCLELSESAALNSLKSTKAFVTGLRKLNCLFALDHVGYQNNNLTYLKHFDVDYIKIDGTIIQSLNGSDSSKELVKEIADLARQNEVQTIAEHVQDPACLAVLWQHGINFIQGHYLQQPESSMNYDFTSETN